MFAGNVLSQEIGFLTRRLGYFNRDRKLFEQSLDTYLVVRRGFLNEIVSGKVTEEGYILFAVDPDICSAHIGRIFNCILACTFYSIH